MEQRQLFQQADDLRAEYEQSNRELQRLDEELAALEEEEASLTTQQDLLERVRVFLQRLSEIARDEVGRGLEQVVTLCLQSVYGEHMSFEIEIESARNNTTVDMYVVDTSTMKDPEDEPLRDKPDNSMGGGVVDVVAIGLRFGLLKIIQPEPMGPIILDEPAKMVSKDLVMSIASLLNEMTEMFQKQSIVITHHEELINVMEHTVQFEKHKGITQTVAEKDG